MKHKICTCKKVLQKGSQVCLFIKSIKYILKLKLNDYSFKLRKLTKLANQTL